MAKPLEPNQSQEPAQAAPRRKPCVGLAVVYHGESGPIPALIWRKCLTTENYDLSVCLGGNWSTRADVEYSETPKFNRWSFLPV
jgi:hypothetical protein